MPKVQHRITNGHCSLQLGIRGRFKPRAVSGQSPDGCPWSNTLEALEIQRLTFAKNAKNTPSWSIYPNLQFHEFC